MKLENGTPGQKGVLEHLGAVNRVIRKMTDMKDMECETESIIGSQNALVSITGANLKYVENKHLLAFEVGRNVHGTLSEIEKQLILGNILKHQKFSDVVIFGDNRSNQCDIPKNVQHKRVKRVVLGMNHSALLFED